MNETNYKKEAMENVKDLVKLLITLSTGIVVFSGTFLRTILEDESKNCFQLALISVSWLSLAISIFCGVFLAHGRIITILNENRYDTSDKILTYSVRAQELFFLIGVVIFGLFIVITIV